MRCGASAEPAEPAEPAFTLTASRALVWTRGDGTTVQQLSPRQLAVLMGVPACGCPTRCRAVRVLGNGIEGRMARAVVAAAADARAPQAAGGGAGGAGDARALGPCSPAARAADAAADAATDTVAWWRGLAAIASASSRRGEGVARAGVLRILDEMGL